MEQRIHRLKQRKRTKVRRLVFATAGITTVLVFLIFVFNIFVAADQHVLVRQDWWQTWIRRQMQQENSIQLESKINENKSPGGAPATSKTLPNSESMCENTRQGKVFLTDDRGYVCTRSQMDLEAPGCCQKTEHTTIPRYACTFCNTSSSCCMVYEFCVSCCMDPDKTENVYRNVLSPQITSLTNISRFDLCKALCRTSSKSILHQHVYKSSAKHCFDPAKQVPPK